MEKNIIGKAEKVVLGLLTAWIAVSPIVFTLEWFFFLYYLGTYVDMESSYMNTFMTLAFIGMFVLLCSTLLHIFLLAFYLVHSAANQAGNTTLRIGFGVGLILIPFLFMPLYYLVYILPDSPGTWTQATKPDYGLSPIQ